MSRATKKYKLVSKVKPKAESWRHFKLYDIKLYCCFVENHDCAKNQIKRNIIAHLIILINVDINIQLQPIILQLRIQFYIVQVGINYQPPTVVPGGDLAKVNIW